MELQGQVTESYPSDAHPYIVVQGKKVHVSTEIAEQAHQGSRVRLVTFRPNPAASLYHVSGLVQFEQ